MYGFWAVFSHTGYLLLKGFIVMIALWVAIQAVAATMVVTSVRMNGMIPVFTLGEIVVIYTPSFARDCRKSITLSRPTIPTNCPFSMTGSWFRFASAIF